MQRRDFIQALGAGALLGTGLAACGRAPANSDQPGAAAKQQTFEWRMVTTWPPNFPGLGTGANKLAELIGELSGGRLRIKVYGAGELIPAFEAFDAVAGGSAELAHGAAYYWKGKTEAAQFFAAVPFGFNAQEMNAWLYYGGGLDLWRELYAPFGLVPFPAGNTGVQMGGWFNREINSLDDLQGLKMRIPGLGGEVLARAGALPVSLPGGEIFTALATGAIDASEWVGPYNDLAFGLYEAAQYYYYPGWHEPGSTLECIVNKAAYEVLPADLQAVVAQACAAVNDNMLAEFTARNGAALDTLLNQHGVQLRAFPADVLKRLHALSDEVLADMAARDPAAKKIHASYQQFRKTVTAWHKVSEQAYYNAR